MLPRADPGVIDDDVESAEVFGDQSDGGVDLVRIDNVTHDTEHMVGNAFD